ncbi:aquaporin-like protein, partial [Coccomyxa subellipsoidea C-169]
LNIAMSFGGAIAVLVYAAASFSGGHLNPAVSVAFWLAGKISALRAVLYIVCQCLGACAGSALVLAIDHNGFKAALGASNRLNTGINPANAWGAETILTCVLVFVVFAATDTQRSATSGHLSVLAPFSIGLAVFLAHLVAVPIDGCSINPARSFGTAAVAHEWTHQWIFW